MNLSHLKNEICEQTESILARYWGSPAAPTQLEPRRLSNRMDPRLVQQLSARIDTMFGLRSYRYGSRRRRQRGFGGAGLRWAQPATVCDHEGTKSALHRGGDTAAQFSLRKFGH